MMKERIAHRRGVFLLCLALIVLGLVVLAACVVPATQAPTPTPIATPQPAISDDDWTRIKDTGVIQVASALNNPPFEMYNARFNPDGFDVALMTEMARRLGLKVEFSDFAFDGLLEGLELKQADAVIAAMAITDDRRAQADFTTAYYVGEDSILAAPDSPIQAVTSVDDLASRRVGVVSGTVYEAWLQKNLIQTGQMPAANLQTYTKPEDAVARLAPGRVDLVILDREVALTYANEGLAKVVGKSKYVQNFGIAVRKGSSLLPQLNKVLAQVQADGTVARLAEKYLNIPEDKLLPSPTPAPQPTVAPAPVGTPTPVPCKRAVTWLDDLSYDDGATVQPGQPFRKGWLIRNDGTCDWTPNFTLAYAYGTYMGGQPVPMGVVVPPKATHEVWMDLFAPTAPGTYQSNFQMLDSQSVPFGLVGWVKIQVPAPATAVPPTKVPPTAAPGVSFWADTYQLQAGQSTWIHWRVQSVKSIFYHEEGQPERGVTGSEDHEVRPSKSTSYYLRVVYNNNTDETFERRITVQAAPQSKPDITRFDSNPQGQLIQGDCVDIYWEVQGAVDEVQLVCRGNQLYSGSARSGSAHDCPYDTGEYRCELQAWGPGGSDDDDLSMDVIEAGPPPDPCEQNCRDQGGQVTTAQRGDGNEYKICVFEDNRQCEACAMLSGACPVGGIKVTGYPSDAAAYCAITGGQYDFDSNNCNFSNGESCIAEDYYNGACWP
jgi:ABC-type amino acid transport substrate-binding protein/putative hemolysin